MTEFLRSSAFSPIVVCAICVAAAIAVRSPKWHIPWRLLSLLLLAGLTAAACAYLFLPVLAEDTETDIAAIAFLAMRGAPVYHAPDAAARYMLLYGPLTYLSHIPFYLIFGASLFSFKLLGFLAFLATLGALYQIARHFAARAPAVVGCGCACVVLLRYVPIPFWGRIDSLLLALVAVAYCLALRSTRAVALIATALAFGAVPNLKFTAVLYLLPLLVMLWMRRGLFYAIAPALLGALLLPLPFLLPNVSFSNYLFILHVNARHGLDPKILIRNSQYVPILLTPVLLLFFSHAARHARERTKQALYLGAVAFCMVLSALSGAKAGAGSYHLLPYVVPLMYLYFWIRASSDAPEADLPFRRYAIAWIAAMLIFSAGQMRLFVQCLRFARQGGQAIAQIEQTEAEYPGKSVQVGPGADFTDPRTLYAFVPVFAGNPYSINPSSIRDLQFGGVALPNATYGYFQDCQTPVWLIPAGQTPFSAVNTYYSERYAADSHFAFDSDFRRNFLASYTRAAHGSQFDTWICKHFARGD